MQIQCRCSRSRTASDTAPGVCEMISTSHTRELMSATRFAVKGLNGRRDFCLLSGGQVRESMAVMMAQFAAAGLLAALVRSSLTSRFWYSSRHTGHAMFLPSLLSNACVGLASSRIEHRRG